MSSWFNMDGPIWSVLNEVADVVILSVLWWVTCAGIITIGASTTSMFYVMGKKVRKEPTNIVADFFKSFKQNFKQSIPLTIVYGIVGISCYCYVMLFLNVLFIPEEAESNSLIVVSILAFIMLFVFWNYGAYLWAILSRYEMKTKILVKTTIVMVHKHLLTTIANILILVGVVWGVVMFPFIGAMVPGIVILAQSYLMQNLFARYTTTE